MPVSPLWRRRARAWTRRSPVRWWTAVAALGLLTLIVVRSALATAADAKATYGPPVLVPVVITAVAAGDAVAPSAVVSTRRPSSSVPDAEVAQDWAGRTALVPLVPGEVLLASKLAPDGLVGAAALLPAGARALAIPGGPGGRPPLTIGDRVDVLATVADSGEAGASAPTLTVATAALVLHVDDATDTVTVAVTPDEAPAVAFAVATAAVTLALTGP